MTQSVGLKLPVVPLSAAPASLEVAPEKVRLSELPQDLYKRRVKAAIYMANDLGISVSDAERTRMSSRTSFEGHHSVVLLEDLQERIALLGGDAMRLALDNIPDHLFAD